MSAFVFHPQAVAELDEIWEFIAQDSLNSADKVINEIFDALNSISKAPHQGHRRPDLTSRDLRFWRVRSYLIAYAPEEHPLLVVAVLHGRRHPRLMAAILRDRT